MGELLFGLFGIAFVLLVIAAIGHALWLIGAAFLRAMFGTEQNSSKHGTSRTEDELEITERQLRRMFAAGTISGTLWDAFSNAIRIERLRRMPKVPPPISIESAVRPVEPESETELDRAISPRSSTAPQPASDAVEITSFIKNESDQSVYGLTPPARKAEPVRESSKPASATTPEVQFEPVAATQRGTLADFLQAFMEEKNIRWGELISGMLIVGSAVGLVISLWATLKEAIPYFPALLFMLVTAGIHGAGLYTLRRWKLKSTSRGLLIISTLLIPLNFLAAIALSEQSPDQAARSVTDFRYIAAVVVGLLTFGALSFSSGRVLMRRRWWPMFVAIFGPSAAQLYLARLTEPSMPMLQLNLLAFLPLAAYLASTGAQALVAAQGRRLSNRRLDQTLLLLGTAAFSLIMPIGLMIWKTQSLERTLAALSPGLNLTAAMLLGIGLLIHQRVTDSARATTRTIGTALAMCGAALMVATVGLAWPQPELLIAVGLLGFIVMTMLGRWANLPVASIPANLSLGLAVVVGMHLWSGTIAVGEGGTNGLELMNALFMGVSGLALLCLSIGAAATALVFHYRQQRELAASHFYSAAIFSTLSLIVGIRAGFLPNGVQKDWTTPIFVTYAIGALAAGYRLRLKLVTLLGSGLLLIASLHAFDRNTAFVELLRRNGLSVLDPIIVAVLVHAALVTLLGLGATVRNRRRIASESGLLDVVRNDVVEPLCGSGLLTSGLILPAVLFVFDERFALHAGYSFWAAAIWLLNAFVMRSPLLFSAAQILLAGAGSLACAALCIRQPWWSDAFWDPRHLHAQMAALAGVSIVSSVARLATRRFAVANGILCRTKVPVDHIMLGAVVVGLVVLSALGCFPTVNAAMQVVRQPLNPASADVYALGALVFLTCGAVYWAGSSSMKRVGPHIGSLAVAAFLVSVGLFDRFNAAQIWQRLGVSSVHAYGDSAWIALAVVAFALVLALCERVRITTLLLLVLAGRTVPILLAARASGTFSSLTVLLLGLAGYCLVLMCAISFRTQIAAFAERLRILQPQSLPEHLADDLRLFAHSLTSFPIAVFAAKALLSTIGGRAIVQPLVAGPLADWGNVLTFGVPLWLVSVSLLICAARERRGDFMFAASLIAQFGLVAVGVLSDSNVGRHLDNVALVKIAQSAAIGFSLTSIVWLACRKWFEESPEPGTPNWEPEDDFGSEWVSQLPSGGTKPKPLGIQLGVNLMITAGLALFAALAIIAQPAATLAEVAELGKWTSYLALALTTGACLTWGMKSLRTTIEVTAIPFAIALTSFNAASTTLHSTTQPWFAFHTLTGAWAAILTLATAAICQIVWRTKHSPHGTDSQQASSSSARPIAPSPPLAWDIVLGTALLALALRAEWSDPLSPWWPVLLVGSVGLSAAALGVALRSQMAAYASVALAMFAVTLVRIVPLGGAFSMLKFIEINLGTAALGGLFWLGVEVYWQQRWNSVFDTRLNWVSVHRTCAIATLVLGWLIVGTCIVDKTLGLSLGFRRAVIVGTTEGAFMVGAISLLIVARLWDRTARYAVPALFAYGLMPVGIFLDLFNFGPQVLLFAIGCALSAYVLAIACLWSKREVLHTVARNSGIPEASISPDRIITWLQPVCVTLGVISLTIGTLSSLTLPHLGQRLGAAAAGLALAPALALLGDARETFKMRYLSLLIVAMAAAQFGWAIMPTTGNETMMLLRTIRFLSVAALMTFAYAMTVRSLSTESRWHSPLRTGAATLAGFAIVALVLVLAQEVNLYEPGGVNIGIAQIVAVSVVLVVLAAALILMAVLPGVDPLELSDRGRMFYVYAAEVVVALLFLHNRLTIPRLFSQILRPYWPIIVVVIAFCGIGAGEWFRRKRLEVLAEPLERTGAFLPLVPAIGFWAIASEMTYSATLFLVGLMYVGACMLRRSFAYGVAAALAGNVALWALLQEQGLTVLAHPQIWLIPPALSVLIAGHINRRNLSESQLTSLRYLCVTVIYVSSSGEMFLKGVGESLWLPMVLALLSVAGVLGGIVLRVCAFLYLGSSFLLLSIVSMVWHAAQRIHHVWPWWVFGIGLGIAILTLFGLFEKKRNEALQLVDTLRAWDR